MSELKFRLAAADDVHLLFEWANDDLVRANSYNQQSIVFENHAKWFSEKLKDPSALFLIFLDKNEFPVGQVRYQINDKEAVVGILIDKMHRGKGYASKMLSMAADYFHMLYPDIEIHAFVKVTNIASYQAFIKAGYNLKGKLLYNNTDESFKLVKRK
jgi:UDP-2,4-diacetamido-2,4,6-trideoxy-beta-L-altropyranose hydrolase